LVYAPGMGMASITVVSYTLTMDKLPYFAVAGRKIRFSGRLTTDTTGVGGEEVRVKYCLYDKPHICYDIGSTTTATDGSWYFDWDVPYRMAGKRYLFRAYHPASGVESSTQEMAVAYPTRLSIKAPGKVAVGASFKVEGKLEYEESEGSWKPLANRSITIYYDTKTLTTTNTGSDGSYSATISIGEPGSFLLKAYFAGEGLRYGGVWELYAPAEAYVAIDVGGAPEEEEKLKVVEIVAGVALLFAGALSKVR